ncbi:O-antigen ligase family protein [candidate division KSB1 bacterium]|nr:O-antigen ligase family protein [candidate division KSB1 bacterium]
MDFHALYISLKLYGLGDFCHYKNLFNPAGHLVNEWGSLILALLPFPFILYMCEKGFASRWIYLVPVVPLVMSIIVSFSRGLYLAFAVMLIVCQLLLILFARKYLLKVLMLCSVILILCAVFSYPMRKSVGTTISFFGSPSQVKSFQGRIRIWHTALNMFQNHPWTGTGGNNYALFQTQYMDNAEQRPLSGRAFNLYIQMLAEKGILGFISFFVFVLFLLFKMLRSIPHAEDQGKLKKIIYFSVAVALLVRDTNYSSLLTSFSTEYLFWYMLFTGNRI